MKTIINNYRTWILFTLLFLATFFIVGAASAEGFSQLLNDF